jgi:hypothetical protein
MSEKHPGPAIDTTRPSTQPSTPVREQWHVPGAPKVEPVRWPDLTRDPYPLPQKKS